MNRANVYFEPTQPEMMTIDRLTIRPYVAPNIRVREIVAEPILEGSTETLPYDPNDDTNESLSKEGSIWDDYVPPRGSNDPFEE